MAMGCAAEAPAQEDLSVVRLVDNGFCAGPAWVNLLPDETVTRDVGPDFYVYRGEGPNDRQWGIYRGNYANTSPDLRRVLIRKNGTQVYRSLDEVRQFDGYFIDAEGEQNHFFANFFKDDASDATFFERIELGSVAKAKCDAYWGQ